MRVKHRKKEIEIMGQSDCLYQRINNVLQHVLKHRVLIWHTLQMIHYKHMGCSIQNCSFLGVILNWYSQVLPCTPSTPRYSQVLPSTPRYSHLKNDIYFKYSKKNRLSSLNIKIANNLLHNMYVLQPKYQNWLSIMPKNICTPP